MNGIWSQLICFKKVPISTEVIAGFFSGFFSEDALAGVTSDSHG